MKSYKGVNIWLILDFLIFNLSSTQKVFEILTCVRCLVKLVKLPINKVCDLWEKTPIIKIWKVFASHIQCYRKGTFFVCCEKNETLRLCCGRQFCRMKTYPLRLDTIAIWSAVYGGKSDEIVPIFLLREEFVLDWKECTANVKK